MPGHKGRIAEGLDRRPHRGELCRFSGRTVVEVVGQCRRSVYRWQRLCIGRMRSPAVTAYAEDSRAAAWELRGEILY